MEAKNTEWRPGPSVCRCCLTEGCYKDISTEYFWMGKREVYAEMLSDTLNVTIAYSQAGGPNSNSRLICEPCISRLRDACDFKRQVLECEKTFMQQLEPSSSSIEPVIETEVPLEILDVKLEQVKFEKELSDDDYNDDRDFDAGDDDDDMDDEPLTKLASRLPKKESVDLMDLLDNTKAAEKRKSTTKTKVNTKKPKIMNIDMKPSPSKTTPKPEKKKKDPNDLNNVAKRNAEIIVKYSTVYPFKLPEENMVCVYCADPFQDPVEFRTHMAKDHSNFNLRIAFLHCSEGYIKVDCTDINCRLCSVKCQNLEEIGEHLVTCHKKPYNVNIECGLQPFKLERNKLACAICNAKCLCLRQLSRHTQSHFRKYTCEACGKSYSTNTALRSHIRFSHINNERICRKCKSTFSSLDEKRKHLAESPKCWSHLCCVCGERFMTYHLKQQHLAEVHDFKKKSYVCQECGDVFIDRKKYRIHFRIFHTDDNFTCSCCGMKFETKRTLEDHRVSHTMEKLFPCTVCSKSFPRKKNLNQHMWIHREQKRFECLPCSKKFNQKVSWKTHMKSYHPELVDFDEAKNNNEKYIRPCLRPYM